ncbi:ATP-dependent Clp protease adaptor ClpS, partial [Pseudomonas sp. SIMBA_041]|uniref:ATP-dependent Clp protease adaptor ClpS n=1 Tax=Pseudomonas sp. SIMBA_041 TaxID=3085782 RepID=UPI00397B84A2
MPAHRAQDGDTDGETSPQADVLVAEPEVAKPPMYAVVMYNDNYTPMEFVVYILHISKMIYQLKLALLFFIVGLEQSG